MFCLFNLCARLRKGRREGEAAFIFAHTLIHRIPDRPIMGRQTGDVNMTESSENLDLPYIMPNQAQKHVTHNEALRALDAIVQLTVETRSLSAPPVSPAAGARYLVAADATGEWAGREHAIAAYQDGAWMFYLPQVGWRAWVLGEKAEFVWDGVIWQASGVGDILGVNTTADTANRLAVSSPASLFTHEGAGHRMKINKAAAGDTASLLYQTGFSGRAEMGLAGDDDFHFKVSSDGAAWREAIVVDSDTGEARFPFTTAVARPNLLINGDFSVNQRGFAGGALSAGQYGFDRWKADTGGADLSLSGLVATLASGAIVQVVEPATGGFATFASETVTVSVENPTADLSVSFGSASGTIVAGSGRQSLTLALGAGDTGNLGLKLSASGGGSVSFGRVKLEVGAGATAWLARPPATEVALCKWYFQILTAATHLIAWSTTSVTAVVNWTDRMRAGPTMTPRGPLKIIKPGVGSYLQSAAAVVGVAATPDGATFNLTNFAELTAGLSYQSYFTDNNNYIELSAEF